MKKLLVEFIGSFFLMLSFSLCLIPTQNNLTPLAVGGMLMALVYSGGHVSGGHFNPAVSLAVFLRGKISSIELPGDILVQFAGAAFASLVASVFLLQKGGAGMDLTNVAGQAITVELLGTFLYCFVVLNVATSRATIGNSFYGIAIGFVYISCQLIFGKISGAALNPAISLGFGISNISGFGNIWIYWVGEILGAIGAAYLFLFINGKEQ